jgi:LCP family protein required for cell wall assembly
VTAGRGYDTPRERPAPRTSDARWQPLPPDPPRAHPQRRERPRRTGPKVFLALLSTLVLVTTGYYWSQLDKWSDGMTTADVIDTEPTEKPADGAIDILMVGMDSRTDAQGHPLSEEQLAMLRAGEADGALNTDTLIMIRIPNDGGRAVGVSLPRDSFVEIPGYDKHKINSAYVRAKSEKASELRDAGNGDKAAVEVESNQAGARKLIETVEQLTGAGIDRYAEVNLLGFYDITNAIGGIDVCLKEPVDDWRSGADFPAGPQTLAGTNALAFVRQRHGLPNGDLDRIVRQQVFMSGMAKKVFSQDMLTPGSDTLENLRLAVQKSVVLSKDWNVIEFAQEMMGFTGGKMEFQTIPVGSLSLETPEDGDAVEVDPDEVQAFVQGLIGQAPQADGGDDGGGDPGTEAVDNGDILVNVRNASGQAGLAASVSASLTDQGFGEGEVGNAEGRESTMVHYAAGEQVSGDQVAAAIGGNPEVAPDENLPAGTVTVLLGEDYDSPSGDSAESESDDGRGSGDSLAGDRPLVLSGQPPAQARGSQPDEAGCVN